MTFCAQIDYMMSKHLDFHPPTCEPRPELMDVSALLHLFCCHSAKFYKFVGYPISLNLPSFFSHPSISAAAIFPENMARKQTEFSSYLQAQLLYVQSRTYD